MPSYPPPPSDCFCYKLNFIGDKTLLDKSILFCCMCAVFFPIEIIWMKVFGETFIENCYHTVFKWKEKIPQLKIRANKLLMSLSI